MKKNTRCALKAYWREKRVSELEVKHTHFKEQSVKNS